jgi:hypothetical protein
MFLLTPKDALDDTGMTNVPRRQKLAGTLPEKPGQRP